MKKGFSYSFLSLALLLAIPDAVNGQTSKAQGLHIIYIDNSERGTNGGLPITLMDYIFTKTIDSINQKDHDMSYLLYISNGDNPYYTRSASKFATYVNKLSEKKLKYPSVISDKAQMRNILYKDKLSGINKITIDFYVTSYYLNQDLLSDNSGYLVVFFPKELQYVTNCPEANVVVNVYYPDGPMNKEKAIRQKCMFSNDLKFASNIKYNFIGK